jgi:hypothetical protein
VQYEVCLKKEEEEEEEVEEEEEAEEEKKKKTEIKFFFILIEDIPLCWNSKVKQNVLKLPSLHNNSV